MDAEGSGSFDILGAIVEEKYLFRREAEADDGVTVDSRIRLGDSEAVRVGAVREIGDPGETGCDPVLHRVAHVGKNASERAGALQGNRPVDDWLIGLRPQVNVGFKKLFEFVRCEWMAEVRADGSPEAWAGEYAEIVVFAMTPIG